MQRESNIINSIDKKQLYWHGYLKTMNTGRLGKGSMWYQKETKDGEVQEEMIKDTMTHNNIKEETNSTFCDNGYSVLPFKNFETLTQNLKPRLLFFPHS